MPRRDEQSTAQATYVPATALPGELPDPATWPPLPMHVLAERDEREQRWGLSYCRRCLRAVVNDARPAVGATKPCQVVRVGFRELDG